MSYAMMIVVLPKLYKANTLCKISFPLGVMLSRKQTSQTQSAISNILPPTNIPPSANTMLSHQQSQTDWADMQLAETQTTQDN